MDLKGTKDDILAKANNGIAFYCYPPSEDGGNSDGGNSDGGNSDGGNSLKRNVALAHSNKMINQTNSIGMGFNPFHINEYPIKINQTNSIGMGFNPFHINEYPIKINQTNSIGMGFNPSNYNINTKLALAK